MKLIANKDKDNFLGWYHFISCTKSEILSIYCFITIGFGTIGIFLSGIPDLNLRYNSIISTIALVIYGFSIATISFLPCISLKARRFYYKSEEDYKKSLSMLIMLFFIGFLSFSYGVLIIIGVISI